MKRASDPTNPQGWASIGLQIAGSTSDAAETAATLARSLADRDALILDLEQQLTRMEQGRRHQLDALQEAQESIAKLSSQTASDLDTLVAVDARCAEAGDQLRLLVTHEDDSPDWPGAERAGHLIEVLLDARALIDGGTRRLRDLETALTDLAEQAIQSLHATRSTAVNLGTTRSMNATRDVLIQLAIVTECAEQTARALSPTGRTPNRLPPTPVPTSAPAR